MRVRVVTWMCLTAAVVRSLASVPEALSARPAFSPDEEASVQEQMQDGRAVIRGRIVASDSRTPLRRVQVICASRALGEPLVEITDGDGRYEFSGLPAGRYSLTATRAGYARTAFRSGRSDTHAGTPIDLSGGEVFDEADFVLAPGGVITGRITDDRGEPVIDVAVTAGTLTVADERARFAGVAAARTDDEGTYRLWGLPRGAYYVLARAGQRKLMASAADVQASPTFYPGVGGISAAKAIQLEAGEELGEINFAAGVFRLSKISGTVLDSLGRPARDAKLMIAGVDQDGTERIALDHIAVGPAAAFVVPNLPPGDYELIATMSRSRPPGDEVATARVSIDGQDVSGLMLTLSRAARMSGTMSSSPEGALAIPTATLRVTAATRAAVDSRPSAPAGGQRLGAVKPDGSFEVPVLPGRRVIKIVGLPTGWAVQSILHGDRELLGVPIDLAAGMDLRGLRISLTNRLARLRGQVIHEDGRAAAVARVVIFPKDDVVSRGDTSAFRVELLNQAGRFEATGLRPGEYLVAPLDDAIDNPRAALDELRKHAVAVALSPEATGNVRLIVAASGAAIR